VYEGYIVFNKKVTFMRTAHEKLQEIDYRILSYISRFDSIPKEKVLKKFKRIDVIELRLDIFLKTGYSSIPREEITSGGTTIYETFFEVSNYIESQNGDLKITNLGKKAVQDYIIIKNSRRWESSLRLWIPLIISLVALGISVYGLFKPIFVRII